MRKFILKYQCIAVFTLISLCFLFIRWFIFKGFNGTDDLHYAMLASRLLKGNYSPFVVSDIFSGRILLVSWQAFIYFVGGVNVFTTQAGTLFAAIIACYLTVFKMVGAKNIHTVAIASSLFYFNPILTQATLGSLPDIYVTLSFIVIFILWNNAINAEKKSSLILNAAAIGAIIISASFFKESALLFIPFTIAISFFESPKKRLVIVFFIFISMIIFSILCLFWYHHFTENFFFRLLQINSSNYENPCSYEMLPIRDLAIRLTYGVWKEFIDTGFYPVILAAVILFFKMLSNKTYQFKRDKNAIYFVTLLLIALYFPFSLNGYQPLCYMARHFLFLLPLGVAVCTKFITDDFKINSNRPLWVAAAFVLLAACIVTTPDEWQWMIYGLMIISFLLPSGIFQHSLLGFKYWFFINILLLSMPYPLFYGNSNWFNDMQYINKNIQGDYYYFPDHDNMSHWQLLHGFDTSIHTFNLEQFPFAPFKSYYEKLDTNSFHPGWFIVNSVYTDRGSVFIKEMELIKKNGFFEKQICKGDVCTFFIDKKENLIYLQKLVFTDEKSF